MIGAIDAIDKKLVQMYFNVQTNNTDKVSAVDPDKMMQTIALMALTNKAYIAINHNQNKQKIA